MLETRTIGKQATLVHPFQFAGLLDGIQPSATYIMNLQEEQPDVLSLAGWRQCAAMPQFKHRSATEYRYALVCDGGQSTKPPAAPVTAIAQIPRVQEMMQLRVRHR